ncbi:hypothetical protein PRVXH_002219 [Proteinivorax hydrogeniformans]|uniref:YvrJ family protein n=1 Tax=Proteinivorax hydrogeniformans TaxID=1826727 RepID=A0AAU8HRS8_9FIRM
MELLLILIFYGGPIAIVLYFLIKLAVKNAIRELEQEPINIYKKK